MASEPVATVSRLDVISRVMDKILSYIVAVLLVAMSAVVFGNVICRYFLDIAWGGTRRFRGFSSSGSSFWGPSSP